MSPLPLPTTLAHREQEYVFNSMSHDDLEVILPIENKAQQHPWTRGHFESSLNSSHQCWILSDSTKNIVAYAVTSTAADEAELLNITVAVDFQRQGLGRLLLEAVCNTFDDRIAMLFLEVRESNHGAIALYQAANFNEMGVRPNYYPAKKGREDAIIMGLVFSCS